MGKLTLGDKEAIRKAVARGESKSKLAEKYGVHRTSIRDVAKARLKETKPFEVTRRQWFEADNDVVFDDGRKLVLRKRPAKVLCISCTQSPFHARDAIPFIASVIAERQPDAVILQGDIPDIAWAKYPDINGPSASEEVRKAREFIEQLGRIIPKAIVLSSNHAEGRVAYMQKMGRVPDEFMRPWHEVYGCPPGWEYRDYVIMGGILFEHGDGVSKGARTSIREEMIRRFGRPLTVIRGHRHGLFGETIAPYWETRTRQVRIAYTGCLMDEGQVTYTKSGLWDGVLLINEGAIEPIPMERGEDGRWTGRIVPYWEVL